MPKLSRNRKQSESCIKLTMWENTELKKRRIRTLCIIFGYSTLKILKKPKRYTSYQTQNHLVESLILSKIDYCNVLFKGMPKYQIQRINKLIQPCAGFVKHNYGELKDIADFQMKYEKRKYLSDVVSNVQK